MRVSRAVGLTDRGRARDHNEDCFRVDAEQGVFFVADGMGGHRYGEIASRVAIRAVSEFFEQTTNGSPSERPQLAEEATTASSRIRAGMELAHGEVLREIENNQTLHGMGTTLVGMLLADGGGVIGNVGDSRAYLFRAGRLELVTEDHTWVNEQIALGHLSEEDARKHPLKNVVTRALGGEARIEVDVRELDLRRGDLLLLCSDGLTSMLSDGQIAEELARERSLEETCTALIDSANELGGLDNITVVLVEIAED